MAICEGGGSGRRGAKNRGNLRSKLFASGPMRISAANYNYSRNSRAWKRLFDERIAWWGRGRKVEEVMGGLKRWSWSEILGFSICAGKI